MGSEISVLAGLLIAGVIAYLVLHRRDKMPQGLQIWDESGQPVLDTNQSVGRVIDIRMVSSRTGSYTIPGISSKGRVFTFVSMLDAIDPTFPSFCYVDVSGDTISWVISNSANNQAYIGCGVY